MFIQTALAFVLPEPSGEAELQTRAAPASRLCPGCNTHKGFAEFHSKGNGRLERECKSCSNTKRNARNRNNRKKIERTRNARKETKTINIAEFELIEQPSKQAIDNAEHLEMLLQDFVFDFSLEE